MNCQPCSYQKLAPFNMHTFPHCPIKDMDPAILLFLSFIITSPSLWNHLHQYEVYCNISHLETNQLSLDLIPLHSAPSLCSHLQQNFTKGLSLFVNSSFSYVPSFLNPITSLKLSYHHQPKSAHCQVPYKDSVFILFNSQQF